MDPARGLGLRAKQTQERFENRGAVRCGAVQCSANKHRTFQKVRRSKMLGTWLFSPAASKVCLPELPCPSPFFSARAFPLDLRPTIDRTVEPRPLITNFTNWRCLPLPLASEVETFLKKKNNVFKKWRKASTMYPFEKKPLRCFCPSKFTDKNPGCLEPVLN